MTQFETELIRAIEHGCPLCGHKGIVKVYSTYCASAKVTQREEEEGELFPDYLDWDTPKFLDEQPEQPYIVLCGNDSCDIELWREWADEGGWIPELQEIVKGE